MKHNNLHPHLARLLARTNMQAEDIVSDKRAQWQEFLERISRSYYDHEQDQYLLERSMEISSREMMELNEKLEYAQRIAHLGYWSYNEKDDNLVWSKEMYELAGMEPSQGTPTIPELMEHIHPDYRERLADAFKQAFAGKTIELELQYRNTKENKYYWHYVKCHPDIDTKNSESANAVKSVSGIVMDITQRKIYEKEAEKIQNKLLSVSRQAGMAEVATTILHNIGNIMNSANVSLNIIKDSFSQPYFEKLCKIAEMIQLHMSDLGVFLTQNPKGKLIPNYLFELVSILKKESVKNLAEINNMDEHLSHIKDIVSMQKIIGGTSSFPEKIFIPELIDTALKMSVNPTKYKVKISKEYNKLPFITTDKSKLLQILVNLLQNAQDAVLKNSHEETKTVRIVATNGQDTIQIKVIDNGIGITKENIDRVFSFGFTTKEYGHGFGLHSSALSAKDLGGSLKAQSEGPNCGAAFILTLPTGTKK